MVDKLDNVQKPNVDRMYHGYNHPHYHHQPNPYGQSHYGLGMNSMYYPSYNVYANHQGQGYSMKVGGGEQGHGQTGYGGSGYQQQGGYEGGGHDGGQNSGHYGGQHGGQQGGHHGYTYEQAVPRHKKKKQGSALSALTLLAFLFFLNLLQNCLKDHIMSMNPTVMVMTAGVSKEGYQNIDRIHQESRLIKEDEFVDDEYFQLNKTQSTNKNFRQNRELKTIPSKFKTSFSEQIIND